MAQRHRRYDEATQKAADEKAHAKSEEKRDDLLTGPLTRHCIAGRRRTPSLVSDQCLSA